MLTESTLSHQTVKESKGSSTKSDLDISLLQSFLFQRKLDEILEDVFTDPRDSSHSYTLTSLLKYPLSIFFFRLGSKNKFFTESTAKDSSIEGVASFMGQDVKSIPCPKTVDNFLDGIPAEQFNEAMCQWFDRTRKTKIFFNHEEMLPFGRYQLNFDAVYPYTHKKAHKCKDGSACPYCLKRESKDKKTGEIKNTYWVHGYLVASFVFAGGMTIPIWVHPLKTIQQPSEGEASSTYKGKDKLKQESEQVAFKEVLRVIRQRFPNLKIDVQSDSIQATKPALKVIQEENCGYGIVRKETCLPKAIGEKFDELHSSSYYKKHCYHSKTIIIAAKKKGHEDTHIFREYWWCNGMDLDDDLKPNVIRFKEKVTKGSEIKKEYKCEWLDSKRISKRNACKIVIKNRRHWEEEDLFNTVEMRGFNLRHNYSRDPLIGVKWHMMLFFAFAIIELFHFSDVCLRQRGIRSVTAFFTGMFHEIRLLGISLVSKVKI